MTMVSLVWTNFINKLCRTMMIVMQMNSRVGSQLLAFPPILSAQVQNLAHLKTLVETPTKDGFVRFELEDDRLVGSFNRILGWAWFGPLTSDWLHLCDNGLSLQV